MKANTKELFKNNFNFDSIASNDDTVAILQDLDIAENNLNQNPNNRILLNKYIVAAQSAAKELKKKYRDFWTNPAEQVLKQEDKTKNEDDI